MTLGRPAAYPAARIRDAATWDFEDLDPFDRMLLTTDGTVTTLLEACTGEPIVTRTTRQSGPASLDQMVAAAGCWWHPESQLLGLAPAERLIARRVTLCGAGSGAAYVMAESLVVPDIKRELALTRPTTVGGRISGGGVRGGDALETG